MILSSGELFPKQGVVDFVDNRVDPNTGTLKMRAVIPNPDKTQRPGQFVTAKVTLADQHKVVMIPAKAVAQDEGGHYVYLVNKDSKVNRQDVGIGAEYEQNYVIEKGIKPGDRVVVSGLQKVKAGTQVDVVIPETKPSGTSAANERSGGRTNDNSAARDNAPVTSGQEAAAKSD
jgi:RND family efflux transporter MFP subunit